MNISLDQGTALCRLLADPSRLRLLLLLEQYPLSTAELTEVTGLTQSRVSTHLSKLVRAGLVETHRGAGSVGAWYRAAEQTGDAGELWRLMRGRLSDKQATLDLERAKEVLRRRKSTQTWAESVAGRMERHYSPGRTWEATANALIGLLELGDVLDVASGDGVLAELLVDRARSVVCVDLSAKVLAAASRRLRRHENVLLCRADMHALPFAPGSFDQVFMMHALPFTRSHEAVLRQCANALRPSGSAIISTLNVHTYAAAMQAYDHLNRGIDVDALSRTLMSAGLNVRQCRITSREQRPPYFEVITAIASKPPSKA